MHYVIGDVHGCRRELDSLLHKIGPGTGDTLIFTGDYIDWGPDPVGVLRLIRDLSDETGAEVVTLKGDHEQVCLLAAQTEDSHTLPYLYRHMKVNWWAIWECMGGAQTSSEFLGLSNEELLEIMQWFDRMPLLWSSRVADRDVFISHAGLNPWAKDWVSQSPYDLLWSVDWEDSYLARTEVSPSPWDLVIYGHAPRMYDAGVRKGPLVPVDGGCVQGGLLVAYCIEDDSRYTVRSSLDG